MVHDARGNLREDRQGRRAFDYDPTNRMVAFHRDGELRSEYDYDMQGRRIRKRLHRPDADGVRSVRFVYDTEGRLVSETRRRDDRSAVKARDIVWLGSLPLAQIERRVRGDGTTRSADVLSLHPGHLGEPREARDADGTIVWRWGGDAFGANMGSTPAVNRDPDGDGINTSVSLRFPGQYHDRESGLFYNHHRDYDPKLGRYVQSDPIGLGDGVNRYAYVKGDPVSRVDPTGLFGIDGPMTGFGDEPLMSDELGANPFRRVWGGMYHKDAHDGIGGLYGPGGQLEDDYNYVNDWALANFGVTAMEYMTHPDGGHPNASAINNQIIQALTCSIRSTSRGNITIPPGFSPLLIGSGNVISPFYMRHNPTGALVLTPEWAIDSTEGAEEFYNRNGGAVVAIATTSTLAGGSFSLSGVGTGGGVTAGSTAAVIGVSASALGVITLGAGWIVHEAGQVNNTAPGNCMLTTR